VEERKREREREAKREREDGRESDYEKGKEPDTNSVRKRIDAETEIQGLSIISAGNKIVVPEKERKREERKKEKERKRERETEKERQRKKEREKDPESPSWGVPFLSHLLSVWKHSASYL